MTRIARHQPRLVDVPFPTEAKYQERIVKEAEDHGWLVCHVRRSLVNGRWLTNTSSPGFPDLVLVKPPLVVFLELKRSRKERPTPAQVQWISAIQQCSTVEAYVASPEDLVEVLALLRG